MPEVVQANTDVVDCLTDPGFVIVQQQGWEAMEDVNRIGREIARTWGNIPTDNPVHFQP